jgi:hypothetical protein
MGHPAITSFIVTEEHSVLVWNGHYKYEQFIQELLNENKQQATLQKFLKQILLFFIHVKVCNNKLS